jgi:hypothetical protein
LEGRKAIVCQMQFTVMSTPNSFQPFEHNDVDFSRRTMDQNLFVLLFLFYHLKAL